MVYWAGPHHPSSWHRWWAVGPLTVSVSRLDPWQRCWIGGSTDWARWYEVQVAGYSLFIGR